MNKAKHVPIRTCVICRNKFFKYELLRYTCPEEDQSELVYDPGHKLPGRGFYLCGSESCRKKMAKFRGWRKKCKGGK
ncbi:MAG: YlxR family protein [Thermodesulfobacteriota bacterium]